MKTESTFDYVDTSLPFCSFSTLEELKETGELCDVTIKAGKRSFKAHRVILAAGIPYFRAMFKHHFAESRKTEITMQDVNADALYCLISFAYTGRLCIPSDDVETLLTTAIYLQLKSVSNACFQFLSEQLDFNNMATFREYAVSDNCVSMIQRIDQYVGENFEDFSKSEVFLGLSFPTLKELVSRDDLFVISEDTVFEAVMRWVRAKENERLLCLQELLHHVRIPLLKPGCLTEHAYVGKLVGESSSYSDMLNAVFSCNFTSRERYCRRKHHLKCSKITGCAMYCVCDTPVSYCVQYYDPMQAKWLTLLDFEHSDDLPYYAYVVCTEEKLFFIQNKRISVLCLNSLEFTTLESSFSICHNNGIACTLHNGKVYLFGGYGDRSNIVQCLCLQTGMCFRAGRMIEKRKDPGVVSLGQDIYVIGGQPPFENDAAWSGLISAERFNPSSGRRTEISPMLQARYNHTCAALNDKIYVLGGYINYNDHVYSQSAEVYDPVTDQWNWIAGMNRPNEDVSLVAYSGKLYAVRSYTDDPYFPVEVYDPDTNEWKSGPPVLVPEGDAFSLVVATVQVPGSKSTISHQHNF